METTAKDALRQELGLRWTTLWPNSGGSDRPPVFPSVGRAAQKLRALPEYKLARTIAVMPDPALLQARINAMQDGKSLLAATPGLKQGLVRLTPEMVPVAKRSKDLRGGALFGAGRPMRLPEDKPNRVDMVLGAVMAADDQGHLLGDGRGLLDLFCTLLRAMGCLGERAVVAVLIDREQLLPALPQDAWDVGADIIVTAEAVIRPPSPARPQPALDALPAKMAALPLVQAARQLIS